MLSSNERAIMIRCCHGHDVAFCHDCARSYGVHRLCADWYRGKTDECPRCRADLSDSIREHLRSCELVILRSRELVADSRALWDASVILLKEAHQTVDATGDRIAEAEAELEKRRTAPLRRD